jgi:hypothetical protein
VRFAYYDRLSRADKAIYRTSDEYGSIELEDPAALHNAVADLRDALEWGERGPVQTEATRLCEGITDALGVPPVAVDVLEVRPHGSESELHGLYTGDEEERPRIRVWMRTARHRRIVAFRTFLRTLLHELCHHLDYELLELEDSFHTEGFFMRESSLFRQLVPREQEAP